MSEEGIVESTKATVLKRTPVDFVIETPILGSEVGDDLGSTVQRVKLAKHYEQHLREEVGQETVDVAYQKAQEKRKSKWEAVKEYGEALKKRAEGKFAKLRDGYQRAEYDAQVVKLGDDPNITQEKYDAWERQRKIEQRTAAHMQQRERDGHR